MAMCSLLAVCLVRTTSKIDSIESTKESEEVFEAQKALYGDVEVTNVVSVYDGDTFTISVDGWPPIIGQKIGVRVAGIDTPEMRDSRREIKLLAIAAKDFTSTRLKKARKVELLNMSRDKYFRILADVEVDGNNLGELLVEKGLAKPYDGGTKVKWTMEDYNKYINQ